MSGGDSAGAGGDATAARWRRRQRGARKNFSNYVHFVAKNRTPVALYFLVNFADMVSTGRSSWIGLSAWLYFHNREKSRLAALSKIPRKISFSRLFQKKASIRSSQNIYYQIIYYQNRYFYEALY